MPSKYPFWARFERASTGSWLTIKVFNYDQLILCTLDESWELVHITDHCPDNIELY